MNTFEETKKLIINERNTCSICGEDNLVNIMSLTGLPLTGRFSREKVDDTIGGIDQNLLYCSRCGHGQLYRQVDSSLLYDSDQYSFKTSLSEKACSGTEKFISFTKNITSNRKINCILDVGCNDLYLLNQMKSFVPIRVGLDPIWAKAEPHADSSIHVIGQTVEDVNFDKVLPCRPDLVVCRHTLEHIYNPVLVLEKLISSADEKAVFMFEVPGFETLIKKCRFDHVFHEHLQYFSLSSLEALITRCGAEIIDAADNYDEWGTLITAFKKKTVKKNGHKKYKFPYTKNDIDNHLNLFQSQMENTLKILNKSNNLQTYGYGAALMLPVLAYHLKSDLSFLNAIIDDDIQKDGIYYQNLPLKIQYASKVNNLEESTVLITAVDNVKPIMKKLLKKRPRNTIYPFHLI